MIFPYKYVGEDTKLGAEDGLHIDEATILAEINKWDTSHLFDYTYQPNRDTIIKSPLLAKNYFNKSHFCNAFTIPQVSEFKIKVMNVRE